jgi:hypothetical protein
MFWYDFWLVSVRIPVTLTSRIYKGGQGPIQNTTSTPKGIQTTIQDLGYYAPRGPNLSKFCVPCTFEFLISVSPHLNLPPWAYPSVGSWLNTDSLPDHPHRWEPGREIGKRAHRLPSGKC